MYVYNIQLQNCLLPVYNVGQQVIVFETIVNIDLLIVHG
jgi:hypothetical protein